VRARPELAAHVATRCAQLPDPTRHHSECQAARRGRCCRWAGGAGSQGA
jgi:hypothetical protein